MQETQGFTLLWVSRLRVDRQALIHVQNQLKFEVLLIAYLVY